MITHYKSVDFVSKKPNDGKYGLSFKTIAGESRSVTEEITAPWSETTLPTILSRFPLENIFNADEFGLFFQCLPNTGLAAGNALGERLQMFVIGKSAKPRCFKGVKTLPCRYRSQKRAGCLESCSKNVDNCTAHPHVERLKWVELIFLPPNTTSHTQPMDQGIIRALKAKYRSVAVRKLIKALDEKVSIPKFSILAAMFMLRKCDDIDNQTFTNCVWKSGISQKDAENAINDDDDPFKDLASSEVEEDPIPTLDADLSYIKRRFPDHIDSTISVEDFIDFDIEVSISLKTADIIADITGTQDEEDEEDEEDDDDKDEDNLSRPTAEQLRSAITVLEDLSVFSEFGEEMLASQKNLNKNIKRDYDDTCKQSIITDFFQKN
ncbi:tigger transposable element-derived protein 4-like [Hydractinia symbiolongicarpus]|uniref:tigger transposable element-derived protein 4-like n=1 Tax=Hydractinia symbiolongicarpus TaxID=13093 RepID=UPI00254F90F6|nr:tigger transposable element-derived protein 4-like [Hydractinia symbiolongicarpus]